MSHAQYCRILINSSGQRLHSQIKKIEMPLHTNIYICICACRGRLETAMRVSEHSLTFKEFRFLPCIFAFYGKVSLLLRFLCACPWLHHTILLTTSPHCSEHCKGTFQETFQELGPALRIPALFGVHDLAEASTNIASRMKALTTIASQSLGFARWPKPSLAKWLGSFQD